MTEQAEVAVSREPLEPRSSATPEPFAGAFPIVVEGLRNRFGDQIVHDGLDLTVRKGEILGVVGGSGTGKSVLMRSIIGLQTPAEGEVEVLGENMVGRTEDEAKNIRDRKSVV